MGIRPFKEPVYHLDGVQLAEMSGAEAEQLGPALAAIAPWERLGISGQAITTHLSQPDPALNRFAIKSSGALAGSVCVRDPWLKGPYLELLAVLPAFQRRGLGAQVLQWFEVESLAKFATPPGQLNLWLLVSSFNAEAITFYQRHGFEPATPLPDLARPGFTEILMRKML